MKKLSITFFLLVFTLITLAQRTSEKKIIIVTDVKYVEIVKLNDVDALKSETKTLSTKQAEDFVQKWNNSKSLGVDKYKMQYYVYVFLKDGQKRQFTISGSKVQESDWLAYDFSDKLYFDNVWNAIK